MTLHPGVKKYTTPPGIEFLLSHRASDGWWRDFETLAGESDEWVTAYVGCCLAQVQGGDRAAQEALELLLSRRRTVGWGYNQHVPADCDTTAWVCHLIEILEWTVLDEYHRAIHFLRRSLYPSGGIPTYPDDAEIRFYTGSSSETDFSGWTSPHICVTANVANLQAFQGDMRLRNFLLSSRNSDRSWSGYWWADQAYPTMLASRAVQDQQMITAYTDSAFDLACYLRSGAAVLDQLTSLQQEDGGWPASARLRIPAPFVKDPELTSSRISFDQNRIYTTATAVLSCNEFTD